MSYQIKSGFSIFCDNLLYHYWEGKRNFLRKNSFESQKADCRGILLKNGGKCWWILTNLSKLLHSICLYQTLGILVDSSVVGSKSSHCLINECLDINLSEFINGHSKRALGTRIGRIRGPGSHAGSYCDGELNNISRKTSNGNLLTINRYRILFSVEQCDW